MSALTLYLPQDSVVVAMGADAVADALQVAAATRGVALELRRTSSRGLFWLEPLLEVEVAGVRHGLAAVQAADADSVLTALLAAGAPMHPKAIGPVAEIPQLKRQQRQIFSRAGLTRPVSLDDYQAHGGGRGLQRARTLSAAAVVEEVLQSGLRGRGGAAFPAGIKWRTVQQAQSASKYVVCNADEGDSGTFADRMVMEGDPLLLIEGMKIAALAVGATQGYIYVRSEYPQAVATLRAAIAAAEAAGWLGEDASGQTFHLEVRVGAGAYICGEETAMLESIEGKRGTVRAKPPIPALAGLFGQPTLVHNVLSFAAVPGILADGAATYQAMGMGRSRGTLPFQLAGNVRFGGLYELAFGPTLHELVNELGGGTRSGRPVKAAQVGGPLGAWVPLSDFDLPLDYEAFAARQAMLGHGGVVVADDSVNLGQMARFAMAFCAEESCGKCTPCRIGSTRGVEVIDRILHKQDTHANVALLHDLCDTLLHGSLCALGGMTPYPVQSALRHFPQDFGLTPEEAQP
ncbi:NADH-ubiquinone oxidoreductase-F iron-sulfur binding region domain-containing protein [Leeia aquatica]|uniref:Formate dehydrogenase n=1 Tax=Leeia aquatica TaxID=2725557 RepID=A0A847SBT5_9NEIS|nr:NADH-ubiquinone oxidoreductase-F iron-sulfur binding region domain-containing protein [Leeia aquatica]NLR74568.1 formate dehydrogenase [Leeia aquatica]